MERNYELDEEALIKKIKSDHRMIDIIYLMQKYVKAPSTLAKEELREISKNNSKKLSNRIDECLKVTIENNLTHLLTADAAFFLRTMDPQKYREFKNTDTYKIFDKYVFPVSFRISDFHLSITIKQILSCKNLDSTKQYDILIKSLNAAIKYLNDLETTYSLDIKTMNYFTKELLKDISHTVDAVFNSERFIKFNENISRLTDELSVLNDAFYKAKGNNEERERLHKDIEALEDELSTISNKEYDNIIGFNEINGIYEVNPDKVRFNFEELKRMIKSRFNTSNNTANKEQLKYVLWIMQLTANSKTDILPFQDKFILDNMIIPWSQELRELLGEDFDNTNFNIEESIKYINRLRTDGEYKSLYYKTVALKRIFEVSDKPKNLNITEYKYRDTLTTDYSDRMNCILKVLKKNGTKAEPALEEKNGFIVYKNGNALDDSDIELFWYLIGELEEHGCEQEIVFRKSDIVNNMGYKSLRGNKLDNLTSSLMNLNAQSIAIIDNRDDKVGKRLDKVNFKKFKGTQLLRADIIGEGDEVLIKFTSPFSKYFRQQKQFGRLLNREMINKYLYSNTRVLKISRELSRMLFINGQKNKKQISSIEINYDTLIKNIGEWDRYTSHSNQRVYLSRLTKDIEKAISYIDKGFNHEIIKTTPRNISNGKIKLLKKS